MGCLPLLLLFPLGCGIGWLLTGSIGALWGGGFGLLLGFVLMGLSIRAMRARR
jgi:hypothetical protein